MDDIQIIEAGPVCTGPAKYTTQNDAQQSEMLVLDPLALSEAAVISSVAAFGLVMSTKAGAKH